MVALRGFVFKQLTELPLLKILGGQYLPNMALKASLEPKELKASPDLREKLAHRAPRVSRVHKVLKGHKDLPVLKELRVSQARKARKVLRVHKEHKASLVHKVYKEILAE
jgi:hypothetical protein